MWNCSHCHESVEADFEICWKCGTTRDGQLDPTFQSVDEASDELAGQSSRSKTALSEDNAPWEMNLADQFVCPKCSGQGGLISRLRSTEKGALGLLGSNLIAVSCRSCGFTELYNYIVLKQNRTTDDSVADVTFPRQDTDLP